MAPTDATVLAAPPVKGAIGDGLDGVVVLVELEPPVEVPLPLESTKLAHVRRVVLLVWMTMERLPKKDPTPDVEETY